jgi:DNA-binding LacI/PurR family transcriptional regulator
VGFDESVLGLGDFSVESGYYAMSKILEQRRLPTALFAGNDTIAVGAISAVHEAGLSVPGDIAIVGFDDLPVAAYVAPRLTTVATQAIAQGEQAALAAIELLQGQSVGQRNCDLSLELVVRESCGARRSNPWREERRFIP